MRGGGKRHNPRKKKKRRIPEQAKQRSPPPRYSPSRLKTSCMLNSGLPFWAGQTRQRCGAPGPGPPPTPRAGPCPSSTSSTNTSSSSSRRGLPHRPHRPHRRGLQRRGREGKGARGKGAGAVAGPSLSWRPRRLRSGREGSGGMERGGGWRGCRAPGEWGGRERSAKGAPPAQGTRTRGPLTLQPSWPRKSIAGTNDSNLQAGQT